MRVVLDTNVFVSGVFFSGPPHQILKAWSAGKLQLVSCRFAPAVDFHGMPKLEDQSRLEHERLPFPGLVGGSEHGREFALTGRQRNVPEGQLVEKPDEFPAQMPEIVFPGEPVLLFQCQIEPRRPHACRGIFEGRDEPRKGRQLREKHTWKFRRPPKFKSEFRGDMKIGEEHRDA